MALSTADSGSHSATSMHWGTLQTVDPAKRAETPNKAGFTLLFAT
jgi:hypothetical protein